MIHRPAWGQTLCKPRSAGAGPGTASLYKLTLGLKGLTLGLEGLQLGADLV